MTRYYSPQAKSAVLARLVENGGDIALTAFQMNVPERTLRGWRREVWLASQTPPTSQQPEETATPLMAAAAATTTPRQPPDLSEFKDDLGALGFMRRQILSDLLLLSVQSHDSFAFMTPYQRGMMITQLIDRIMKLDQHLQPYQTRVQEIRVIREDEIRPQLWIEVDNTAYGPYPISDLDEKIAYYQKLGLDPRIVTHPADETVPNNEPEG